LAGSFTVGDWVGVTTVRSNCGNCNYCVRGRENLCNVVEGGKKFGGVSYYSSYINVEPQWVFPVPKSIPEQSIVPLLNEGAVIYSALRRYARPGDSIGVIGAGSLGQLAVAFSRALGYKTTLVATKQ
jgi:propanol-preferring alcohol dehydrogenase